MAPKYVLVFALSLSVFLILPITIIQAQTMPTPQPGTQTVVPHKSTTTTGQYHSEGERVFTQNCSRCHTAPDGFSPRISDTVVRHMRVRAQLSKHDEQELLHFLNP